MKNPLKISLTPLFTIILLLGFAMPLNPVGNWYQQFMPNLNGRQIVDIAFLDSLNGYAISTRLTISDSSLILKTTNGGDNWSISFAPTGYIFKRIQFVNQTTGYVGGTGLLKTTNSGNSWLNVNSSVTMEDLSFKNKDTGWYAYSESITGGVFFTSTGGASWQNQFSGGTQNPNKIYMFNARIGFMSNNSALPKIYKTTNSGMNWNVNVSGEWFNDIKFTDSLTGWYSNVNGIYKTTNGGSNWQAQVIPTGTNIIQAGIYRLSLFSKDTLWAAGNAVFYPNSQIRGILLRTINGGDNWLYQIPDTSITIALYSFVQFVDKNNGWVYNTSRGIHTTTGGDPVWITAIEQVSTEIPKEFKLFQNYPNPFNPNTKIKFQLLKQGIAEIIIYDITGRRIQKLLNEELNAGEYEINFNADGLSSGTYFYKLIINSGKEVFTETKRMVLIK